MIERNARLQAQLIDDLLDVSRIVSGKLRMEPRPIDLRAVVEAGLEAVQPAAGQRGVAAERPAGRGSVGRGRRPRAAAAGGLEPGDRTP